MTSFRAPLSTFHHTPHFFSPIPNLYPHPKHTAAAVTSNGCGQLLAEALLQLKHAGADCLQSQVVAINVVHGLDLLKLGAQVAALQGEALGVRVVLDLLLQDLHLLVKLRNDFVAFLGGRTLAQAGNVALLETNLHLEGFVALLMLDDKIGQRLVFLGELALLCLCLVVVLDHCEQNLAEVLLALQARGKRNDTVAGCVAEERGRSGGVVWN